MEEKIKTFRYAHGRKTYRMAWIVEYCLFAIALSLAGFNIAFGVQEGDILTGLLLAIGWAILAVIELSIIPMAGSFRLAKGINRVYSGAGLVGLLCLSAFTVYEFNEIASEYMTRGARQNAITVERLENDIQKLQSQIQVINSSSDEKKQTISELNQAREAALASELARYEKQKEETEQYYSSLLEESNRSGDFSVYNPEEQRRLERTQSQIAQYNQEIQNLENRREQVMQDSIAAYREQNRPQIESLQAEITRLRERIEVIQQDKETRINETTGNLFRSKENRIASIQEEANGQIAVVSAQIRRAEQEIVDLRSPDETPPEVDAINMQIADLRAQIEAQQEVRDQIESVVSRRLDSPEFKQRLEDSRVELDRLYQDRIDAKTADLERHNQNVAEIEASYEAELAAVEGGSRTEGQRFEETQAIEEEIGLLQGRINEIIEETSQEYEKTMYFRMATWFSDESSAGFGKLPTKADYNRSLRFIFLPIGVFFGLTAVILAYLGNGFMFEESKRFDPHFDIEELEKRNAELEKKQEEMDSLYERLAGAEENKNRAIGLATRELRSKLSQTEAQLENQDKLREQIRVLKSRLEQNEDDLVKAKQRVFDVIKSIPQTVTIIDDSENRKS